MPRKENLFGVPIRRAARSLYGIEPEELDAFGRLVLKDFHQARRLAARINATRDLVSRPEDSVRASDLNSVSLMMAVMRRIVDRYGEEHVAELEQTVPEELEEATTEADLESTLVVDVEEFPPPDVASGKLTVHDWVHRHAGSLLIELALLRLMNDNPGIGATRELLSDEHLHPDTDYEEILDALHEVFDDLPPFGPDDQHLLEMLEAPQRAAPDSLLEQLDFIRNRWGHLLGDDLLDALLRGQDLIREETRSRFGGGPPRTDVYDFEGMENDQERFSADSDWMPKCVLIAKNAYVWLEQLSRKYERHIDRLDQIPAEELQMLARRGINGLWLIGLWQRSEASAEIKRATGSEDAVASAYSLFDYRIADRLGGESAFEALKEKAWQYGVRLAADMVPNHVGIDSKWVREHPEWFLSVDEPPFPSYSFDGPDLCDDPGITVQIEDHYYDQSDAAVVFVRRDHETGETRYIYHGNDGTSMPWNDTAQLDYLNADAREAVIETIVEVARRFPIIRFDAAMTLVKKHIRRLWYPEPGGGGAIASRAEHGITDEEFHRRIPAEFWAEVVDRIHEEVPDTLLLAEAFWMMEGYFVRSLGMHRVYNSAFMNMLRSEDNAGYRQVMKNTLEFDPQILKRYVNFMNNPDEDTAIHQFGDGDQYFGVCTLMATMPGLPMLGHGQIEGLHEKYGMDFYRPLLDETPNDRLIRRHEEEIFPLLHRRRLFAEVDDFLLYDVERPDGSVDENVFAYSNRRHGERALVVYHNHFGDTRGRVMMSVAQAEKSEGEKQIVRRSLAEGLGLDPDPSRLVVFRDHVSGLEYIRSSQELCERGFFVDLDAYDCHVFLDWREIWDDPGGIYHRLMERLDGMGVQSIEDARRRLAFKPLHDALREALEVAVAATSSDDSNALEKAAESVDSFVQQAAERAEMEPPDETELRRWVGDTLADLRALEHGPEGSLEERIDYFQREPMPTRTWLSLHAWLVMASLTYLDDDAAPNRIRSWMSEWHLADVIGDFTGDEQANLAVRVLLSHAAWAPDADVSRLLEEWLGDPDVRDFIGVHRANGVVWFHKESFEELVDLLLAASLLTDAAREDDTARAAVATDLRAAAQSADYRLEDLLGTF